MYLIQYTQHALQDLNALDKYVSKRITKKIIFYSLQKNFNSFAKALSGRPGVFRFRIGEYRALFRVDSSGVLQVLLVLRIKHRKDIYDL